jgi:hypothetical protein
MEPQTTGEVRSSYRVIQLLTLGVICLLCLGYMLPQLITAETKGVRKDGILIRYQPNSTGKYLYPIVRIDRDGRTFEIKSESRWRFRWYEVGEHIPVWDTGVSHAYVGSWVVLWSDALGAVAAIVVVGIVLWFRARVVKPARPLTAEPGLQR